MENLQKEFLPNRIGKRRSIVIMAVAGFFIAGLVGLSIGRLQKTKSMWTSRKFLRILFHFLRVRAECLKKFL